MRIIVTVVNVVTVVTIVDVDASNVCCGLCFSKWNPSPTSDKFKLRRWIQLRDALEVNIDIRFLPTFTLVCVIFAVVAVVVAVVAAVVVGIVVFLSGTRSCYSFFKKGIPCCNDVNLSSVAFFWPDWLDRLKIQKVTGIENTPMTHWRSWSVESDFFPFRQTPFVVIVFAAVSFTSFTKTRVSVWGQSYEVFSRK